MLMFVALSAAMLPGLTATMTQAPVYADTDDCKKNDDKNCNDRTQDIKQENSCKVKDNSGQGGDAKDDSDDAGSGSRDGNDNNQFGCGNELHEPNTGEDSFNGPSNDVVIVTTSNDDPFASVG